MKTDFFKGNFLLALGLFLLSTAVLLGGFAGFASSVAFGFFVPGFLLLSAFRFKGSLAQVVGLSLVASVLLSSHAVYWASVFLGQYSLFSIFAGFAALSVLAFFYRPIELVKASGEGRAFVVAGGVFLLLFAVFANTLWVETESGIKVGGWNWSDLFAHLPISESVNNGNFPPQTPFFAGEPLNYHWFSDLHSAFLSKASLGFGLESVDFMRVENAFYSAVLVLLFFCLAGLFLKNPNAALVAAVLSLFAGSFAFANFLADAVHAGESGGQDGLAGWGVDVFGLVKDNAYDNDWKYFQVPSVLGGFMIVQRPQMAGFPSLVAVVLVFASALSLVGSERLKRVLLAGVLAGLVAPFQYYAFASALLVCFLFFLCFFVEKKDFVFERKNIVKILEKKWKKTLAFGFAFAIPALLLAAPFALSALSTTNSAGNVKVEFGWLAFEQGKLPLLRDGIASVLPVNGEGEGDLGFAASAVASAASVVGAVALAVVGVIEFVLFYAANFGVVFLLAFFSLFLLKTIDSKSKAFLGLWMLAMFLVINTLSLSGTQWDMAKFFVYLNAASSILAAGMLYQIWQTGMIGKIFAGLLFTASVFTAALLLVWTYHSNWQALSWDEYDAGIWIKENTPQKSVFAAYPGHISPIDAIAGRFRITGYSSWMANYGLSDYQQRENDLRAFYCATQTGLQQATQTMQNYGIKYAYIGSWEKDNYKTCAPFAFTKSPLVAAKVYGNQGVEIYELKYTN